MSFDKCPSIAGKTPTATGTFPRYISIHPVRVKQSWLNSAVPMPGRGHQFLTGRAITEPPRTPSFMSTHLAARTLYFTNLTFDLVSGMLRNVGISCRYSNTSTALQALNRNPPFPLWNPVHAFFKTLPPHPSVLFPSRIPGPVAPLSTHPSRHSSAGSASCSCPPLPNTQ